MYLQYYCPVTCPNCDNVSITVQSFQDLTVEIRKASIETVQNAVNDFFEDEVLDSYRCEKCTKDVKAIKRFTIEKTPYVLCVHLNR